MNKELRDHQIEEILNYMELTDPIDKLVAGRVQHNIYHDKCSVERAIKKEHIDNVLKEKSYYKINKKEEFEEHYRPYVNRVQYWLELIAYYKEIQDEFTEKIERDLKQENEYIQR